MPWHWSVRQPIRLWTKTLRKISLPCVLIWLASNTVRLRWSTARPMSLRWSVRTKAVLAYLYRKRVSRLGAVSLRKIKTRRIIIISLVTIRNTNTWMSWVCFSPVCIVATDVMWLLIRSGHKWKVHRWSSTVAVRWWRWWNLHLPRICVISSLISWISCTGVISCGTSPDGRTIYKVTVRSRMVTG